MNKRADFSENAAKAAEKSGTSPSFTDFSNRNHPTVKPIGEKSVNDGDVPDLFSAASRPAHGVAERDDDEKHQGHEAERVIEG